MFKQRNRKSRKQILSLIESAEIEDEETEQNQKLKKTRKREIKFRDELSSPKDEGYLTGNEKLYEKPDKFQDIFDSEFEWNQESDRTRNEKKSETKEQKKQVNERNESKETQPARNQSAIVENDVGSWLNRHHLVPMITSVFRRSSPEEDFLWTLTGIQNLIDQQNVILNTFKNQLESQEECDACDVGQDTHEAGHDLSEELLQERKLEIKSLRMFRVRLEQKLNKKSNILFD
eukprot:GFUD01008632.1.p1 GENE.GFUD01008632.1~~GFUD01008632.1.p1  ORF type:complete len:233 (+),score=84.63 GFUD01008632.1:80-778(+)